ncbi:hypothetical protein KUTeg_009220 [Tegillarca granosa]|uniref:Coiled-coil domain-containing protein 74B n=1 Tax=Tegillarca granosa TaxID=220873 RepID=A0ABQ9FC65_TEGGR|nr:hypothetical protein KUTeg_010484 [Tegillarca granosa]KAJ8313230.1 hypothetical protein KUTeg_009220 [Tegillarca granosa]
MIKQGVVQEKIADLTSMNQLPPLSTLPQWSRVNTLDRGRYPKSFVKDKAQSSQDANKKETMIEEERQVDLSELNPTQRIHHLERSVVFLKQQHSEVLKHLHEEIEGLKKENKDLQFKIVMSQKSQHEKRSAGSQRSDSKEKQTRNDVSRGLDKEYSSNSMISQTIDYTSSAGQLREDRLDELKIIFLEEEIKELKHALREQSRIETLQFQVTQGGGPLAEQIASGNLNLFSNPSRPPSLAECEAVIRHLQAVNANQAHELDRLKSDLRDVLYSHKWTPDAYLLAKAYIAEDDAKEQDQKDKVSAAAALPKIALKNPSRKLPDIAYIRKDNLALPALKQTVSNKATERRKRTQILQKARLRNEIIP